MNRTAKPILLSGPLVVSSQLGDKTETRRVATKAIGTGTKDDPLRMDLMKNPYGTPGDLLYVREKWATPPSLDHIKPSNLEPGAPIHYAADNHCNVNNREDLGLVEYNKFRPSIFLPRWASRMTLEILDISIQRLQDMNDYDALGEGVELGMDAYFYSPFPIKDQKHKRYVTAKAAFRDLWDMINESRGYGWNSNPWVWVIKYKTIMKNVDEILNDKT